MWIDFNRFESYVAGSEKPAQLAPSIEQPKSVSSSLQNDDKMPASLAFSKASSEVAAAISPPLLPSEKSTTKLSHKSDLKSYDDTKESPRKKDTHTHARAPQNSKISLALRLLRNRSSAQ